jgi:hypothetical protein
MISEEKKTYGSREWDDTQLKMQKDDTHVDLFKSPPIRKGTPVSKSREILQIVTGTTIPPQSGNNWHDQSDRKTIEEP